MSSTLLTVAFDSEPASPALNRELLNSFPRTAERELRTVYYEPQQLWQSFASKFASEVSALFEREVPSESLPPLLSQGLFVLVCSTDTCRNLIESHKLDPGIQGSFILVDIPVSLENSSKLFQSEINPMTSSHIVTTTPENHWRRFFSVYKRKEHEAQCKYFVKGISKRAQQALLTLRSLEDQLNSQQAMPDTWCLIKTAYSLSEKADNIRWKLRNTPHEPLSFVPRFAEFELSRQWFSIEGEYDQTDCYTLVVRNLTGRYFSNVFVMMTYKAGQSTEREQVAQFCINYEPEKRVPIQYFSDLLNNRKTCNFRVVYLSETVSNTLEVFLIKAQIVDANKVLLTNNTIISQDALACFKCGEHTWSEPVQLGPLGEVTVSITQHQTVLAVYKSRQRASNTLFIE